MHQYHARRAARADIATSFVTVPDPRTIGVVEKGQQLIDGNFLFSGLYVEGPTKSIWDVAREHPHVAEEIHGCAWLDDLAAVGDDVARRKAQDWVFGWIAQFGQGRGPGWLPDLTGRRLIRWINHGYFLMRGQTKAQASKFYESLGQQLLFAARRWQAADPGYPRFEALAGVIHAGLLLEGMGHHVETAVAAFAIECDVFIDREGGIASRNPEELMEIFALMNWTRLALQDADRMVPDAISRAIVRSAPVLRALRHADGGLARFHGGGRGIEGRLDEALALSGVRQPPAQGPHMGYARLSSGRTTLIADAAPPPSGPHSADAHASTLGFELTSGRRPVIVNCGSGRRFGLNWRRASRATPSHSTMMIDGVSSSHLDARASGYGQHEYLVEVPGHVRCNTHTLDDGRKLEMSHNGYQASHGLTHARTLSLSVDGRTLTGEDILTTLSQGDQDQLARALHSSVETGIPYTVRFHLHPDVSAEIFADGSAVALRLKSGEVWVFQHDGTAKMALSASVYLQNGRLKPRATQQVVLSGHALAYATRVRWSLAKAQDTPAHMRDLALADLPDLTE